MNTSRGTHSWRGFYQAMRYGAPLFAGIGGMDSVLREQIMLKVSLVHGCPLCVRFHKKIGKLVGLSEEDISALDSLDAERFEHKTWVALTYAEHLAVNGGRPLKPEVVDEMKKLYTSGEITKIEALEALVSGANEMTIAMLGPLHKVRLIKQARLERQVSSMTEELLGEAMRPVSV